jgi:hypothetical protein
MIKFLDPNEWYLRQMAFRVLQGLPTALPFDPEPEPGNVVSIAAARTRRATAQIMHGRATRERPL